MITRIKVDAFVRLARQHPVLDVRSPGEFETGHIPGAHSFPLFDNHERAEVGTIYKQSGQMEAMAKGMDFVGPKVGRMFAEGISMAKEGQLLVHCWRGGKRSEAVAGLLGVAGLKVSLLEGGYKQFRNWVLQQFNLTWPAAIIGGLTGTGKTDVLHAMQALGENTVDLEALADHRGSAFGRLGATRQVTFTQFENDLAWQLTQQKPGTIWFEDESRTIGNLYIPNNLWVQMRTAPIFKIVLPRQVRMERLMRDYGTFPKELLAASISKLQKRMGGLRTQETLKALEQDDDFKVMDILLDYYDKSYAHTVVEYKHVHEQEIPFPSFDAAAMAGTINQAMKDWAARNQKTG